MSESAAQQPQAPEELQRDTTAEPVVGGVSLSSDQTRTLVRLLRVAYPHDSFPDGPYERTAQAIADADGAAEVLTDGIAELDGLGFIGLDDDAATVVVQQIAKGRFFALVHSTTIVALYDDHEVWELLGYEGPSFDKGGYLERGFDDLDWLPDARVEEYDGEPRTELA